MKLSQVVVLLSEMVWKWSGYNFAAKLLLSLRFHQCALKKNTVYGLYNKLQRCTANKILFLLGTGSALMRPCLCVCLHNTMKTQVKMWPGSGMLYWLSVQTRPQRPDFSLTGQSCFTRNPTLRFVLGRTEVPARLGSLRTGPRPSWWTLHIEQEPASQYT